MLWFNITHNFTIYSLLGVNAFFLTSDTNILVYMRVNTCVNSVRLVWHWPDHILKHYHSANTHIKFGSRYRFMVAWVVWVPLKPPGLLGPTTLIDDTQERWSTSSPTMPELFKEGYLELHIICISQYIGFNLKDSLLIIYIINTFVSN